MRATSLRLNRPRLQVVRAHRQEAVMTTRPKIAVDIWSDLACPWCWVGWQRLSKAAAAVQGTAEVEPTWHAFLLDPRYHTTHPSGEPLDAFYQKKFGGRTDAIKQRLIDSGTPDGATFSDWRWRPNTFPGHRLVALARAHGKSHEANAALFRRSFEGGQNISDPGVLIEAGNEVGLPGVEEWVRSDEGALEVLADSDAAVSRRVTGVPAFFIRSGDSPIYFLSGAQPVDAFVEAFERVLAEASAAAAT